MVRKMITFMGDKTESKKGRKYKRKDKIKEDRINKKKRIGGGESIPPKRLKKDSFSARSFPPAQSSTIS